MEIPLDAAFVTQSFNALQKESAHHGR